MKALTKSLTSGTGLKETLRLTKKTRLRALAQMLQSHTVRLIVD
jgi:hypothetical protein